MTWWKIVAAGVVGGVAATVATNLYQALAAPALDQGDSDAEPSNEQAADSAGKLTTGQPIPDAYKHAAGNVVHYATGVTLGLGYAALAARRPAVTTGYGVPFGLAVALALDDILVPAFGWGPWPTKTPAATHVYGATTHAVFGAVLEGGRRLTLAALD